MTFETHPISHLNVPNTLTLLRMIAAPFMALAVLTESQGTPHWVATAIVLGAAVTDMADGWLARALDEVSTLGTVLDPIADKMLIVTTLFLLAIDGTLNQLNLLPALTILWRELFISGMREYWQREHFPMVVSTIAKLKTVIQFGAVVLLFFARLPELQNYAAIHNSGIAFLWLAAALTLYSAIDYIRQAWRQA